MPVGLGRASRSLHLMPSSAIIGFQSIRRRSKLPGSSLRYCTHHPGRAAWESSLKPSRTITDSHPVLVCSGQKPPEHLNGQDGGFSATLRTVRLTLAGL